MEDHTELVKSILYGSSKETVKSFLIKVQGLSIPFLIPLARRFPSILTFYLMEKVISIQPQSLAVAHTLLDEWVSVHPIQENEQEFFDIVSVNARYLTRHGLMLYLKQKTKTPAEFAELDVKLAEKYLYQVFDKRNRIFYPEDFTAQKNEISLVLALYPLYQVPKAQTFIGCLLLASVEDRQ